MVRLNHFVKRHSNHRSSKHTKARIAGLHLTIALSLLLNAGTHSVAQEGEASELNSTDGRYKHLGVETCASSTCHGSTVLFADSNVLQNEFRTWNEQDPHARAYKTLLAPESKLMAKKLGLESAETADMCLGCHADNVAANKRGDEFQLADGVSCEACHGGAESYLESHMDDSHQDNLAAGLRKTEDPTVRGQLCLSCHLGNHTDRKITHTIMGAGHPRLSFELNTFTGIQPAHYEVDEDYIRRKGEPNELQTWAIGQLLASEQLLSNINQFSRSGLFPELVHMDCLGCHQPMSKVDWQPNPLTKLSAGALRYNDSHLLMAYQIARAVTPTLANQMLSNTQALLGSKVSSKSSRDFADKLRVNMQSVRQQLEQQPLNESQAKSILSTLISNGLSAHHQGYALAEQSAMAINSVVRVMNASNSAYADKQALISGVDKMFEAVNDSENYKADSFINGLRKIRASLK